MLIKLLKYDIISTARMILPIYSVFIIINLVSTLTNSLYVSQTLDESPADIVALLLWLLAFMCICFLPLLTVIILFYDFYQSMVGLRGYITHTLPVSARKIMLSKTITVVIWAAVALILLAGAICLIAAQPISSTLMVEIYVDTLDDLVALFSSPHLMVLLVLELWLSLIVDTMLWFAAVSVAACFNKHRPFLSIVFYIVLDIIFQQIIVTVLLLVSSDNYTMAMFITIVEYLIISAAAILISSRLFGRRTNLQ